jgi:hypothetical protein
MGPDGNRQLSAAGARPRARSPVERAAFTALAGLLGAALLFSPVKLCLMALLLRLPCPGCGMTRATLALLRGDFARAFALHPLSLVIGPLAAAAIMAETFGYLRTGRAFGGGKVTRAKELVGAALVLLLVGTWLARFFGYFGGPVGVV